MIERDRWERNKKVTKGERQRETKRATTKR